jgi:TPR repeat protein
MIKLFNFIRVSETRESTAQNDIGASYQYGFNGETDEAKAIHWYTLAAKQNHAPSIHNLGLIAFNSAKNEHDYQKALTLFEKAAKLVLMKLLIILVYIMKMGSSFHKIQQKL